MKTSRTLAFLIVALSVLTGLPSAFASKAVANRAYVQSGPDGVFYARCIPKDNAGPAGTTNIYRVKSDGDELVDHYDWYSAHSVVLGWSPIAGKVAVMALHRGEPTTPDNKQVEISFHLGGKLLKSWTTADLVRLGAEIHLDRATGGNRAEFQVLACEQIEIPGSNQYAFKLRLSTGRDLFFNILTGDEYIPLGRDLDFKRFGAVVTPKPETSPLKSPQLPADGSPESIAAAAKMGAETAAADIKAGVLRILYYGEPFPLKPLVDEATGYRVQIVAGCIVSKQFVAEADAYNQAMRDWHAKNPAKPKP